MKDSVAKRIRITRTGKVIRRNMGVDHFRARKSKRQKSDGRSNATLNRMDMKNIKDVAARV